MALALPVLHNSTGLMKAGLPPAHGLAQLEAIQIVFSEEKAVLAFYPDCQGGIGHHRHVDDAREILPEFN